MIFYSLLAVIFLSPLPYGANRPWSVSLCILLIAILGFCWAVRYLIDKRIAFFKSFRAISDIIIAFLLVIIWAILQQSPVFPNLNHPLWQLQAELLHNSAGFISLTINDTIIATLRYSSYALVFWLSLCYSQDVNKARKIISGFMISGLIYCAYGLVMDLGGFNQVLFQKVARLNSVSSTFINHNHFSTFAGLTLLCCSALLYESVIAATKYGVSKTNMGMQLFLERLILRAWLPLSCFIVISTALILTYSRGGVLSTFVGLIVLLIALNVHKKTINTKILGTFIAFIIMGGSIFYVSADDLVDKINHQGFNDPLRMQVNELVWNAILTNPYVGFGWGSFTEAFTLYKSVAITGAVSYPVLWDYAHNTYLETIFELGFPAALAFFYCFLRLALICIKGLFIRKKDWLYPAIGLSATVLIATHATVDFSMQLPAVAYSYALLMGCACAQSFSSTSSSSKIRTA
jgi:O-antigen ligase